VFPFNISATTEGSDIKIGRQVDFVKTHHKIPPRRKVGVIMGQESSLKFWGFPLIFLQRLKLATSNLVCSLRLPRSIIKLHAEKSGHGPGLGELLKVLRFPFNISATAEASDFKFGMQLTFIKDHHKITPRGKAGVALG